MMCGHLYVWYPDGSSMKWAAVLWTGEVTAMYLQEVTYLYVTLPCSPRLQSIGEAEYKNHKNILCAEESVLQLEF